MAREILTPDVRAALTRAFADFGYTLDFERVIERRYAGEESWVWWGVVNFGTWARTQWDLWRNTRAQTARELVPSSVALLWHGICHECGHIWQEQTRGRLWYTGAVLNGLRVSFPYRWVHYKVPMEREADTLANMTWKRAYHYYSGIEV